MGMDYLEHYGTKYYSGRYPWGSGKDPHQRSGTFNSYVADMRKEGLSDLDIAKLNGMTTTQFRQKISLGKADQLASDQARALELRDRGYSVTEVGRRMNKPEATVRNLLNPAMQKRAQVLNNLTETLEDAVKEHKYIDIGVGSENYLGVARTKLQTAVSKLKNEKGYVTFPINVEQPFLPGKNTTILTLAAPGTTIRDIYLNKEKISVIGHYSEDLGETILGIEPPRSVDSKKVKIVYAEEGGTDSDGFIELRAGRPELSIGENRYGQVRIMVDGTHYIKGMAMASDDLPKGYDIVVYTNKPKGTPKLGSKDDTVLKNISDDPDNPFKSTIRQLHYTNKNGEKELGAVNIVGTPGREETGVEGSWDKWSRNISSQVLSKQDTKLAKKQLGLAYDRIENEYNTISKLTNPAVKKKLLESFAEDADSASVHLKAAALPRQSSKVIIPFPSIKEGQIYAPTYNDGEKVVLIRHPHGGKFEIPELTVNNKHREARKRLGAAEDAIGVNSKTAAQLSGADFDGDTVIVIPNNRKVIKTEKPLEGLKDFDPKISYPKYDGMTPMSKTHKETEMGVISNLITDMTIKGASSSEISRAVKHSMVVIDAEKHELDYRQSYKDNNILELKKKYQNSSRGGASTLISRASGDKRVPLRKEGRYNEVTGKKEYINPRTGEKLYTPTGESYMKNGKTIIKTTSSTQMAEEKNPYKLSSGTDMENVYAEHALKLKKIANQARKDALHIKGHTLNPSAKKVYANEIASLNRKLSIAVSNKPLERQAQIQAEAVINAKKQNNPNMTREDLKKKKTQALSAARNRAGAKKQAIEITSNEWDAIQAGAISNTKLTQILNNVKDLTQVKEYATPRTTTVKGLTASKIARARALLNSGKTQAEVARQLGVSVSTLTKAIAN